MGRRRAQLLVTDVSEIAIDRVGGSCWVGGPCGTCSLTLYCRWQWFLTPRNARFSIWNSITGKRNKTKPCRTRYKYQREIYRTWVHLNKLQTIIRNFTSKYPFRKPFNDHLWYGYRPFVREPYIFSRSLSGKTKMMMYSKMGMIWLSQRRDQSS